MSGVARGVEGASEYAVDERGNPFWTVPTTCDLCWEPSGEDGPAHLRRSGASVTEVALGGEPWAWWFSPYGYFPEHLIVASREHRPMAIDHGTIARLLDFSDAYPRWFIGSNADLPIVGGSLPGHDHFQGGGHRFPLMNVPIARAFSIEGLESVGAGIVRWPASVVRLRSRDRRLLAEAACRVLDAWRPFSFEECDIRAFSLVPDDGREGAVSASGALASPARFVQHNTANPILWREGDDYVMDLVLRNNRTTPEHPFGLFHVPERLFHIKKENIGLIEIMGRAILPARLAAELPAVKDECSRAFYEILVATGVFKDDAAGRRGLAQQPHHAGAPLSCRSVSSISRRRTSASSRSRAILWRPNFAGRTSAAAFYEILSHGRLQRRCRVAQQPRLARPLPRAFPLPERLFHIKKRSDSIEIMGRAILPPAVPAADDPCLRILALDGRRPPLTGRPSSRLSTLPPPAVWRIRPRFVQHNTANLILWREGDDYVMDLVLRNNRTTPEHPFGLFHVPERLFHIKKENIGLIEIMGRAILPTRLAAELLVIKDECSRAFYEILVATGVFKDDAAGRRGWEAFLATI